MFKWRLGALFLVHEAEQFILQSFWGGCTKMFIFTYFRLMVIVLFQLQCTRLVSVFQVTGSMQSINFYNMGLSLVLLSFQISLAPHLFNLPQHL